MHLLMMSLAEQHAARCGDGAGISVKMQWREGEIALTHFGEGMQD